MDIKNYMFGDLHSGGITNNLISIFPFELNTISDFYFSFFIYKQYNKRNFYEIKISYLLPYFYVHKLIEFINLFLFIYFIDLLFILFAV